MGKHQRQKGKRGERECAKVLRDIFGVQAIRAAQANGKFSEDVLAGLPGCYHEVKFYARHSVLRWMDQAEKDCGEQVPLVFLRENGNPQWYVLLRLTDAGRFAEAVISTPNAVLALKEKSDGIEDGEPRAVPLRKQRR